MKAIVSMLRNGMKAMGASSSTFYVEDPWWPGEMRVMAMPGVKYTEPMQGFLLPISAKRKVTEGATLRFCEHAQEQAATEDDPVLRSLVSKNRLYGGFSQRENVVSYVRLIHKTRKGIDAVLFVNFERQISRFDKRLNATLRHLMRDLVQVLPDLKEKLLKEDPFPLAQLFRILQSAQVHLDASIEENFKRILNLAFEVSGLNEKSGLGTIHLFDEKRRVLRLIAPKGNINSEIYPGPYERLNVDEGHGIVSWVALRQQEILIDDLGKSEFKNIYVKTLTGVGSELAVPILSGNRLVGVLNLESRKKRAFTHPTS